MPDIVLIYPHFRTHVRDEILFHPLGIAQLTALLRRSGLNTLVVDCTFRQWDEVVAEVQDARPRIVGIYVMISLSGNAVNLARELRQLLPGTLFVCGGPLPTLRPEQFAGDFDMIFRGEAVNSFPRFCADYLKTSASEIAFSDISRNVDAYPGVYARCPQDGSSIHCPPQSSDAVSLNRLPIPERSDYDHLSYQRFWMAKQEGFTLASIMTSFGCPYNCDFCSKPVFGNSLRRRSIDHIIEEIRDIHRWGYTGLWIGDDCFTFDMERVRAFCRRLIVEKLGTKWTCLSRADRMTAQDVQLMREAGCQIVYFGLESGSNETLKLMNKKTTVEIAEQTVQLFSRSGIRTAGFFMVGYPGETYETIETTFSWALSLPLDEISFTVPYPLPGAGLFDKVCDVVADADWRCENENRFFYRSEFDEEYLKRRIEETYAEFDSARNTVSD